VRLGIVVFARCALLSCTSNDIVVMAYRSALVAKRNDVDTNNNDNNSNNNDTDN
jgi:hypothetical protein